MSSHCVTETLSQAIEFRYSDVSNSRSIDGKLPTIVRDDPPSPPVEYATRYLRNGARIVSFDERSNSALCIQDGEWSVWLLDEDGERIRGSYFDTLRAAAFDYAERVMGYNSGEGDEDVSDLDE